MIEEVRKQVCKLLDKDNSGHGMEHVERDIKMSLKFARTEQKRLFHVCDVVIIVLIEFRQ